MSPKELDMKFISKKVKAKAKKIVITEIKTNLFVERGNSK